MIIAYCNGPYINEADNIISETVSYYFSKPKNKVGWNFVTKNNIDGRYGSVIRNKLHIQSIFPFTK